MQDVEKLKYLIFSDKQLTLFNFLGKTIILPDGEMKSMHDSLVYKEKNLEKDIEGAYKYYKKIEKHIIKKNMDERLYNLVDDKIKKYKD